MPVYINLPLVESTVALCGILTFIPRILYSLLGMLGNCSESKRKYTWAMSGYGRCSSIIFVKDCHLNVSVVRSLELSLDSLPTVICMGNWVFSLNVIL